MGSSAIIPGKYRITIMILAMLWIMGTFYLFFQYHLVRDECQARFEELKAFVADEKIVTLTFTVSEKLHWEVDGKELEWHNRWFDVIRIEHQDSKIIIRCIEDQPETEAILLYQHLFKSSSGQDEDRTSFSFHDIKYILPHQELFEINEIYFRQIQYYKEQRINIGSVEMASPPPDSWS